MARTRAKARKVIHLAKTPVPHRALTREDVNRSQIGRDTEIDLSHISRIFSGERRPTLNLTNRIAESMTRYLGFDVTIDDVFDLLISINPGLYLTRGVIKSSEGGQSMARGEKEF